uniref:family 20 glycosylhydrolase n=1 Tax=Peptacetobacter sp. TaxID=2991975 RepID=UPI00260DA110
MKGFKKLIISTLVACMTMVTPASFGMANVSAAKTNKTEMSVYSIDAGRKFFSVNQIKEIIDTANETGFTHVQLLFGNDGLRLVLDDMTISANGKTYASKDVKNAIENGTKKYYDDPNGTVLNQRDMESILSYAKAKNVKIIPVVSSPGHMDAILNTMEGLGIEDVKFDYQGTTSKTTMDLANKEAVGFTKALVEKYAKYFNGKVEYFNFGADEYANDATYHGPSKKSGFLVLQEEGLYDDFINYINEISSIVKSNNMKPICFNDGVYYNKDEENGTVDKDITVAYWTPGFERYTPAPAKYLVEKGYKILNTNDNWYYVVGRNGEGWWYGSAMATDGMKKNKFTRVVGTSEDEKLPIVGSMACTWADEPKATYDSKVVKDLMKLFAQENPEYIYRKANYDVVENAKTKLPKDLSKYTEESIFNLKKALANVVYGERLEDQSKVNAMANDITKAVSNLKVETNKKKKSAVFSIDAGRKYFSKEQLMKIIKKASENGYTDVQLILGNDGLRFVLDDMTISANEKTYTSENVKSAITRGNNQYYKDPNGDCLTEAEMNEILSYAKSLNIGIIPVINSPGHMDGILNAMTVLGINNSQYSYKGKKSTRTIDLNNKEAVEFNKELVKKYVTYFSKYSKVFNFGCDEYANDIDSSKDGYYNGWSRLQGTGMYPKFVSYVNDISKIIKDAGMRPMCFNDGIYYDNNDEYGEFDKDIIISYWTAGWWEFYVAKASYLYEKGHDILNLNDGWYWVLGNIDGKINGN